MYVSSDRMFIRVAYGREVKRLHEKTRKKKEGTGANSEGCCGLAMVVGVCLVIFVRKVVKDTVYFFVN